MLCCVDLVLGAVEETDLPFSAGKVLNVKY